MSAGGRQFLPCLFKRLVEIDWRGSSTCLALGPHPTQLFDVATALCHLADQSRIASRMTSLALA